MEKKDLVKRRCPFCGKERDVEVTEDDGMDYLGHARGVPGRQEYDPGCSCALGKVAHEPMELKAMCANCAWNEGGFCTNRDALEELCGGMFDLGSRVEISRPERKCACHKLDTGLLRLLVR